MDPVIALLLKLLGSYVLGSVVGSLLIGRLRGVDIRQLGSGNAGATNALRTQGKAFAIGTALIDVLKGVAAALLIAPLGGTPGPLGLSETQLACGIAAALGHCYPLFHGFRGGKGAGTLFGALLALFPWAGLAVLALWALVLMSTGFVGLGTVIAGLAFAPVLWALYAPGGTLLLLAVMAGLLLTYTHHSNLQRVWAGNEHRFERARIIGRWLQR